MARLSTDQHSSATETALPNVITVDGQGTPASFEITVDGDIQLATGVPSEEAITVSGTAAEGAVDAETHRFRYSGEVTDVTIVNHGGYTDDIVDPEIYIE